MFSLYHRTYWVYQRVYLTKIVALKQHETVAYKVGLRSLHYVQPLIRCISAPKSERQILKTELIRMEHMIIEKKSSPA